MLSYNAASDINTILHPNSLTVCMQGVQCKVCDAQTRAQGWCTADERQIHNPALACTQTPQSASPPTPLCHTCVDTSVERSPLLVLISLTALCSLTATWQPRCWKLTGQHCFNPHSRLVHASPGPHPSGTHAAHHDPRVSHAWSHPGMSPQTRLSARCAAA